jgi:hypothetical protein
MPAQQAFMGLSRGDDAGGSDNRIAVFVVVSYPPTLEVQSG